MKPSRLESGQSGIRDHSCAGSLAALKNLAVPIRMGVTKRLNCTSYTTDKSQQHSDQATPRLEPTAVPSAHGTSGCSMTLQKRKSRFSRLSRKPRPRHGFDAQGTASPKSAGSGSGGGQDDLSIYLHLAVEEEIVITRHGRPAGVLIGFSSDEDWFEYTDPTPRRRLDSWDNF